MKRIFYVLLLVGSAFCLTPALLQGEEPEAPEPPRQERGGISSEDRQVIRMMELLKMMEMLQDLEILEGDSMEAPKETS